MSKNLNLAVYSIIFAMLALVLAISGENYWDIPPCKLCNIQRILYGVVIVLSIASLIWRNPVMRYVVLFSWLSVVSLAGFHLGIEQGIFQYDVGCQNTLDVSSLKSFVDSLEQVSIAPCNTPSVRILGLSFVTWSFLYASTVLATLCVFSKRNVI